VRAGEGPMPPARVWVMRHAEKLDDPDDPNLSNTGRARAAALVAWFPATFGRPDFIFATAISKHSERPIQTVLPLAQHLGITPDTTYADQDYGALAKYLICTPAFADKTILCCWHHGNIPGLMRGLGAPVGSYPDPWDPAVFNLVLSVDFSGGQPPAVLRTIEPF
jgi:phosphohistidine phosphatase SixA